MEHGDEVLCALSLGRGLGKRQDRIWGLAELRCSPRVRVWLSGSSVIGQVCTRQVQHLGWRATWRAKCPKKQSFWTLSSSLCQYSLGCFQGHFTQAVLAFCLEGRKNRLWYKIFTYCNLLFIESNLLQLSKWKQKYPMSYLLPKTFLPCLWSTCI